MAVVLQMIYNEARVRVGFAVDRASFTLAFGFPITTLNAEIDNNESCFSTFNSSLLLDLFLFLPLEPLRLLVLLLLPLELFLVFSSSPLEIEKKLSDNFSKFKMRTKT